MHYATNKYRIKEVGMVSAVSDAGLKFLTEREGNVSSLYNDTAGHCTVGVGHLVHKGNCDYPVLKKLDAEFDPSDPGDGVSKATRRNLGKERDFYNPLSPGEIEKLLKSDVKKFEKLVTDSVQVELTQEQFDALVSFAFNVGGASFKSSTLLKKLNEGKYDEAADELLRWCKETKNGERVVNSGLLNRRKFERELFKTKAVSPQKISLP
jgi:GH24 family phage-related lysozyme (muramidase)